MSDARKTFDLNNPDPSLVLADEDYEIGDELLAGPPPPPEGAYLAAVELGSRGAYFDVTKKKVPYVGIHIQLRVQAPGTVADNAVLHDDVNTVTFERRDGTRTCTMAMFYAAVGQPGPIARSKLPAAVVDVVKGKPNVKIRVAWRGYCPTCAEDVLKGQKAFPPGKSTAKCPKCGGEVAAQGKIAGYARAEAAAAATSSGSAAADAADFMPAF